MRSLNPNQEILNFYLIDDFNTEDKNIIVKELENRLSNIKNLELEIGSGNGKFIVELAMNNKDKKNQRQKHNKRANNLNKSKFFCY